MNTMLYATQILDNRGGGDYAAGFVRLLETSDWAARAGHTILKTEKTGPFWKREYHYLIRKENAKSI